MDSTRELLDAAYADLGFREGALLDAVDRPEGVSAEDWIDRGEWLSLANSVGVEKVFFVENNPVIVFASSEETDDSRTREAVNRIWCMARPQHLFFARPGDLSVVDLTRPPIGSDEVLSDQQRILRFVCRAVEVQSQLADFRRELVESGTPAEGQGYFSAGEARADKALIQDLHKVRRELLRAGLSGENEKHANALIGRAIFIRYLEDRGILLESDFRDVAGGNTAWVRLLNADQGVPIEPSMEHVHFTKVLGSKEFTYAFFDRIAKDFNGDLFPVTPEERQAVTPQHLRLLQRFLRGEIADDIPRLFFFAYRFEVIPIELISSIYEAFYNAEKGTDQNQEAHYTPIELVEYLLSKALPRDILESNPSILDPACGSGIFLVEAFRRIVRFRQAKNRRKLSLAELKKIIRDQLRGIDINGEAVRVAAFSLYLALLHHVKPPDIWRDKRLPYLTYDPRADADDPNRFNILLVDNSFSVPESIGHAEAAKPFASGQVDVVVGNPPWGFPKPIDQWGVQNAKIALQWCRQRGHEVGDQELSQAFIHRAIDFLKEGGRAALLVSSGVFFKHHEHSRNFRQQWLAAARLLHVVNFSAVRHLFFSSAIAPFASVIFVKGNGTDDDHYVEYWSAKNTLQAQRMNAVVLSLADRRVLRQADALADDDLWKVYWWGNHRDYALVQALECHPSLENCVGTSAFGRGFEVGKKETASSDQLRRFREFPTGAFVRYGPLPADKFTDIPPRVRRLGARSVYEGRRLLVKRGITQSGGRNGVIEARLETEPFTFRHSIYGINLDSLPEWKAKIILGILWSSLARYYFWMTAGSWGTWHHEIHLEDVKRLPIAFPNDASLQQRIVQLVDRLREVQLIEAPSLLEAGAKRARAIPQTDIDRLERELDDLVFQVYGLASFERELVNDMCQIGLDLFYRHAQGEAIKRLQLPCDFLCGRASDIGGLGGDNGLAGYLGAFVSLWNQQLTPHGEFIWEIVRPGIAAPMIAVVLETAETGGFHAQLVADADRHEWASLMRKLDDVSVQHEGSRRIFIDGVVRIVSETEVIVIKRNERRLWTASMAREDAEATIKQAMELQEQQ
jgi:predicted RNA methylase